MPRSFAASATLLVALALPTRALAADVLVAIEEAFEAGQISLATRVLYRVAAVRAPERLPAELRQKAGVDGSSAARSHSRVLVEAYQQLPNLDAATAHEVRNLLAPPDDLAHSVESTAPYPIRVSYATAAQQTKAERILQSAITSYERQVQDWGFWEPPIEDGVESYRFYLMDAGGAAGYTAPYLDVAATAHADAYSYIVIDPSLSSLSLDATVAHEFNHACQVAMDSQELVAFMENSASYVEAKVFPATWPLTQGTFSWFQSQPFRALEYSRYPNSDGYEYGGALWALFLTQTYGDDDPVWLRRVWEGTVQETSENEPDYFDVLDELLAAEGGVAGAAREFSEHRFFVGSDDDGQHLPGANSWGGAEVWRTATLRQVQLPLSDQGPVDSDTRPQPHGCNYVVLDLDGSDSLPLRFSFAGDAALDWDVSVLETGEAISTARHDMDLDPEARGQLVVSTASAQRLVLLICQAAPADYDPDERRWLGGDYRYSIVPDIAAPTVTSASPSELEQGAHDVLVTIGGEGFVDHPDVAVAISGDKVVCDLERVVSPPELELRCLAAPAAELGPRDLIITHPGGASGQGDQLLAIIAPAGPPSGGAADESVAGGGGCWLGRPGGRASNWPYLLVAGALFGLRRRRPARGR